MESVDTKMSDTAFTEFCTKNGKDVIDELMYFLEQRVGLEAEYDLALVNAAFYYSYCGPDGETKDRVSTMFEVWYLERVLGLKGKIVDKLELPEDMKKEVNENGFIVVKESDLDNETRSAFDKMLSENK